MALGALLLAACNRALMEHEHSEDEEHEEMPTEYANLTKPFMGDHEAADAGAIIYEANCVSCHGPEGKGDGTAAANFDPKPANLANEHMMEDMTDGALYWRVSEGGMDEPFNSAMPAWKDKLSNDEIWQVITYLRELATDDHE